MKKILENAIKDYYKIANEFCGEVDSFHKEIANDGITSMINDVRETHDYIKECGDGWENSERKDFLKMCKAFIKKYSV